MSVVLYDLVGVDDRRFSPHCWRSRMALAHKGLDVEAKPTLFTEIPSICDGQQKTVPVIEDNGKVIAEGWEIANYLEQTYADKPSLFGGEAGQGLNLFVTNWANTVLHANLIGFVLLDIHDHLQPEDKAYFRQVREKRFGKTLEEVQAGREDRLDDFQRSLNPIRQTVKAQAFLAGEQPQYADFAVFGAFQWVRVISPFKLLKDDDPIATWFERCLDLYDGLGRSAKGYD